MCLYTTHHLLCTHKIHKLLHICHNRKTEGHFTNRKTTHETYGPGICERLPCRVSHNLLPTDWDHTAASKAHFESQTCVPWMEPFDMSVGAREESERRWFATLSEDVRRTIRHAEMSGEDFVQALRPLCSWGVLEGHEERVCGVEDAVTYLRVHGCLPECFRVPVWAVNPRWMGVEQLWLYTGTLVDGWVSDPFAKLPGMMVGPAVEREEDEDQETVVGESLVEMVRGFLQPEVEGEQEIETEEEMQEQEGEEEEDYLSAFEPPACFPPAPVCFDAPPFTGKYDITPEQTYLGHWPTTTASVPSATSSGTVTAGPPPYSSPGDDFPLDHTLTTDDSITLGDTTATASADEPGSSSITIATNTTNTTEVLNNITIVAFNNTSNDPSEGDFSSSFPSLPSLTSTEFASQDSGRGDTPTRNRFDDRKYEIGDGYSAYDDGNCGFDDEFYAREAGEDD